MDSVIGERRLMRTQVLPRFALGLVLLCTAAGCGYYSFSGATIPSELNTISIPLAQDRSVSPLESLDRELTQSLVDRFVGQTRLNLANDDGQADARLEVTIQRYENRPTAVTGDERASVNRVSINVQARYYSQVEDEEIFSQTFSSFEDYDPSQDAFEGERQAASAVLEQVADDIFTKATSNW